ncbi:uncharacterized protein B4U79_08471, partial [Dinothrombium tinctorium]
MQCKTSAQPMETMFNQFTLVMSEEGRYNQEKAMQRSLVCVLLYTHTILTLKMLDVYIFHSNASTVQKVIYLKFRLFISPLSANRYGKVQSVKILGRSKSEESNNNQCAAVCATIAFIDIKSAAKAHNSENKIDERILLTDYYEPPASSTASSAIFIHESREDALLVQRPATNAVQYANSQTNQSRQRHSVTRGLPEDRLYERERVACNSYERMVERDPPPYIKRNISNYHDDGDYSNRNRSRDRTYNRNVTNSNYADNLERPTQNHFRPYSRSSGQHFDSPRYPSSEQLDENGSSSSQRNNASGCSRNRLTPTLNVTSTIVVNPQVPRQMYLQAVRAIVRRLRNVSRHFNSRCLNSSHRSLYGNRRTSSHNADKTANSTISSGSVATNSINLMLSQGSNHALQHISSATPGSDCSVTDKDESKPLAICVRNLPVRSTDTSLKDGLFHEYKKHGKVTMVKVIGQGIDRFAVVCFKKAEDVEKALEVSKDKLFFGCKIEVTPHEGIDAEDNDFRPLEAESDEYHPKATRTLFVGNLEKDITTTELRSHFEQFGEIIEIDIKKQGTSTYAFIQYSDISSVVKAMRKLDGENLGANRIKLGFGKSMPTNCVWLHGIAETHSEKSLLWNCSRFGPVVNLTTDRERGNCLVFYETVESAQIAVTDLKGRLLNGRKLQVDFANRECQNFFFEKLELSGQCASSDKPWERRTTTTSTTSTSTNISNSSINNSTTNASTNNGNNWSDVEERTQNYDTHNRNSHNRYENQRTPRTIYRAPQSPPPPPPLVYPSQRSQMSGRNFRFQEGFGDRRHRLFDSDEYQENEDCYGDEMRDFNFQRDRTREYSETRGRSYSPLRVPNEGCDSPKDRHLDGSPHLKDKPEECALKERSSRKESIENLYGDWKSTESLHERGVKARPKHKLSDGEGIEKHSPLSRRHSQSNSPPPQSKKKSRSQSGSSCRTPRSPTSSTSSIVNSPIKSDVMDFDVISDKEVLTVSSWRRKSDDNNAYANCAAKENLRIPSSEVISDSEESTATLLRDNLKRKLIAESENETPTSSETIGTAERKKRLLACIETMNTHRETKQSILINNSGGTVHDVTNSKSFDVKKQSETTTVIGASIENVKSEIIEKKRLSTSTGDNIKLLERNKAHLLNQIEQLAPVNDSAVDSHTGHTLLDASECVKHQRSKHPNSSGSLAKCKNIHIVHGAKEISAIPLKIVDATSSLINRSITDPRRQLSNEVCSSSLSSLPSVPFSSSSKLNRRLERSDACEGSVDETCAFRVSSTDSQSGGQQDVHSTTLKENDQGSSEVSSSSDKVASNKRP